MSQTEPFAKSPLQSLQKTSGTRGAFSVVKRNGSLVPFRRERIFHALEMAFRDTKQLEKENLLPEEIFNTVNEVTEVIVQDLLLLAGQGTCLTVEGIQDLVEVTLMKLDHHDVARDYIIYRDQHKSLREDSPENLKVLRKDGVQVRFNPMKIASTIEKAFRKSYNIDGICPEPIIEAVHFITQKVVAKAVELSKAPAALTADLIQDEIEYQLMKENHFGVAKAFILYRASIGEQSDTLLQTKPSNHHKIFSVLTQTGQKTAVLESTLYQRLKFACRGLENLTSSELLLEEAIRNFYDEMKHSEVDLAMIMAARSKIEQEPAYAKVASRLLLDLLYRETLKISSDSPELESTHRSYFKSYLKKGVELKRLSPELLSFDLAKLSQALELQRDDLFSYLGLQTLYDRYFIHDQEERLETPQIFWMRVAMGLALNEGEQKTKRAIEFYDLLSCFYFTSGTPTLFNSGTMHSQLSSCYLSTVMDDLGHIFKIIADDAQLSKWAGGLGNDWSNVRATGAKIQGTNGKSQGVIPFLKVANDTAVAVNQCFDPKTGIYTAEGIKQIGDVQIGDLVLGVSGQYRAVTDKFVYNQKEKMISISVKESIEPLKVTTNHPFYAMKEATLTWIDAEELRVGDFIAQVIPKEVVPVSGFSVEDAKLYGSMLRSDQEINICCKETLRDATTGSIAIQPFSFTLEDFYSSNQTRHIAPRFSHLPKDQTRSLVKALLEHSTIEDKTICFTTSSYLLAEGLRYQLLRLGVLTSGISEENLYTLQIPAVEEIATLINSPTLCEKTWIQQGSYLLSQIEKVELTEISSIVVDLKVDDDESYATLAGIAHNGGKRKGAMCAYLETWHLDIEDFLELRKNTGDERRRTHDMNTANWIPDLFMKRVLTNETWTLFSPNDVPDLHDLYGTAFEEKYIAYEKMAAEGNIQLFKKVEATLLWRKMLSMLFETGHPWITFKDPSNIRSPQSHVGVVHSSNLCTEILLNTSASETAVCNLGSINLPMHMTASGIDEKKLASTIRTAIRMLDNVIDINFYPIPESKQANALHRPIGLGLMGFQDALYIQGISYASHEAIEFADTSMEMISYYAILASSELAAERGTYSSYKGSKWDLGILPIDSIELLEKERPGLLDMDRTSKMDWSVIRKSIQKYGMRNSNTMAIAPTATISNITGVAQSIEPMYKHLFVKSNLSGEFTIPNTYLVEALKKLNLWDEHMLDDLKYFDGSIAEIERIPNDIKKIFLTAFEIDSEWLIECASRRQKWIDMGQSLNLYLSEPSGKKLHQMYMLAWTKGLKTTYYLRSLAATQIEKSTTDINKRGVQPRWMKSKSASSNVQIERDKPLSCSLDSGCESCQ